MLDETLLQFFSSRIQLDPGDEILVAFSGGVDSSVLLSTLQRVAPSLGLRISAAHLDHGMDPQSARRARQAEALCTSRGIPCFVLKSAVPRLRQAGEGWEEAARRVRYGFLEEIRRGRGARYIATAHHRDDQAETVLLRMSFGSGLTGLAGIQEEFGAIVRPFLTVSRRTLEQEALERGLTPIRDPTNRNTALQRNFVRRRLLPSLIETNPGLPRHLSSLAQTSTRTRKALDSRMTRLLGIREELSGEASLQLSSLLTLPRALAPHALAALQRTSNAPYPCPSGVRQELFRQAARQGKILLDAGGGWRLETCGDRLWFYPAEPPMPFFSYTFRVPGVVTIPELGAQLRLVPRESTDAAPQGLRPSESDTATQALLQIPLERGEAVTVRNRRPGDRVALGDADRRRKLKEILINRKVPRRFRDRLPLLCCGEEIVWIPGVLARGVHPTRRHLPIWRSEITYR